MEPLSNKPISNSTSFSKKPEQTVKKAVSEDIPKPPLKELEAAYKEAANSLEAGRVTTPQSTITSAAITYWIQGIFESDLNLENVKLTYTKSLEIPQPVTAKFTIKHAKDKPVFKLKAIIDKVSFKIDADFTPIQEQFKKISANAEAKDHVIAFMVTYLNLGSKEDRDKYVQQMKEIFQEDLEGEANYYKLVGILEGMKQVITIQIPQLLTNLAKALQTSSSFSIRGLAQSIGKRGSAIFFSGLQKGTALLAPSATKTAEVPKPMDPKILINRTQELLTGMTLSTQQKEALEASFQSQNLMNLFDEYLQKIENFRIEKFHLFMEPSESQEEIENEHLKLNDKVYAETNTIISNILTLAGETGLSSEEWKELKSLLYTIMERVSPINFQVLTDPFILAVLKPEEVDNDKTLRWLASLEEASKTYTDEESSEFQLVENGLKPRFECQSENYLLWNGLSIEKDAVNENLWYFQVNFGLRDQEIATANLPLDLSCVDAVRLSKPQRVQLFNLIISYINSSKEMRSVEYEKLKPQFEFLGQEEMKNLEKVLKDFSIRALVQINKAMISIGNPFRRFNDITYTKLETRKEEVKRPE